MKKMFLVGATVACFAFVGCSTEKDVSMTETSDSCCAKGAPCADCSEAASPAVVGEKSHCEGQTGECPFSGGKN